MTGLAGTQVLHLDYHPLNVLIESGQVTAILDWRMSGWATRAPIWPAR